MSNGTVGSSCIDPDSFRSRQQTATETLLLAGPGQLTQVTGVEKTPEDNMTLEEVLDIFIETVTIVM